MEKGNPLKGCLAAASVYVIYGVGATFVKDVLNTGTITPAMLFSIRTAGAALLFWIASLFVPKERFNFRELPSIAVAAALGLIIPQCCTVFGMAMSTPYDASIISTLKPVMTLFVSVILGAERFSLKTSAGIVLAFIGSVILVGSGQQEFSTSLPGLLILLLNGLSFAFYLVLCRPVICRHGAIPLMKWFFLIALLVSIPVSAGDFASLSTLHTSFRILCELAFIIIFGTFVTFFLMPIGQKNISATQYSLFSYMQCITAAVIAVSMGLDNITWQKLVATVFFVVGSIICLKRKS